MHSKIHVHQTVKVGANVHCLIYDLLVAIIFSLRILLSVKSKKYAQHKGFSHFNRMSTSGPKIDQRRKLQQQKLSETDITEFDFTF